MERGRVGSCGSNLKEKEDKINWRNEAKSARSNFSFCLFRFYRFLGYSAFCCDFVKENDLKGEIKEEIKFFAYQNKDEKTAQIASGNQMLLADHIFFFALDVFPSKIRQWKSVDYLLEELGKVSIGKSSVAER